MKNKRYLGIIFCFFILRVMAQEELSACLNNTNSLSFEQLEIMSPWLKLENAAGFKQMPDLFPGMINVGIDYQEGDFKLVFTGNSYENYKFGSKSYKKIKETVVFGSFEYNKSYERSTDFNNVNNPNKNYPYMFADTIGKDTYDREFFNITGVLSSPVNETIDWGLKFDYQVGVAAQNRDPRPENKVTELSIAPGLLFKTAKLNTGLNFKYSYYNEDIDVDVVEENTQYTLFSLHGLGTSTYHTASSFYRLYKQNDFGVGVQLEYNARKIKNITVSNLNYFTQIIDDGRKASNASWSVVKNDAKLNGVDWNLANITTIKKEKSIHQLEIRVQQSAHIGMEYIQRLEQVGETDLEHWVTYAEEEKYYAEALDAKFNYSHIKLDKEGLINTLMKAGISTYEFSENYYLPDLDQAYLNLLMNVSFLKSFSSINHTLSVEARLNYKINLSKSQNMETDNFIVTKIMQPNFKYTTGDYWSPGLSFTYEFQLKKLFNKYFIHADYDLFRDFIGHNRMIFNFSTGINL